jgi:hypothetical protein
LLLEKVKSRALFPPGGGSCWPNYGPLLYFPYSEYIVNNSFCAQFLLHFSLELDQIFMAALSLSALVHLVGFLAHLSQSDRVSLCDRFSSGVRPSSVRRPSVNFYLLINH